MKKYFLIILTFLLSLNLNAQTFTDSVCTDFETSNVFIKNLSNSWQIGSPNKVVLNNSFSPIKSIITDTINTYPNNDTSVFYAVYSPSFFVNYLRFYFPFRIEFDHRYNTDSLSDFGTIELSKDGGATWINGLSTSFSYNQTEMDNSHFFFSTNDTIYDSLSVTGSSNGWVHSIITKDLRIWNGDFAELDSIIVRFTFTSDSLDTFKDGWQIDNLCLKNFNYPLSIEENQFNSSLKIYPNPFSYQTSLETEKFLKDATLIVYNQLGHQVKQIKNFTGQSIILDRENLSAGIYFIQLSQENKKFSTEKLIIIDN